MSKVNPLFRLETLIVATYGDYSTIVNAEMASSLRAGMVGMGMIFDETYRPFFEQAHAAKLYDPRFGACSVELAAVASRTGSRAEAYRQSAGNRIAPFISFKEPDSIGQLLKHPVDIVCVA